MQSSKKFSVKSENNANEEVWEETNKRRNSRSPSGIREAPMGNGTIEFAMSALHSPPELTL
jgi:hypothetical protein